MLKNDVTKILRNLKINFSENFKGNSQDTIETFLMVVFGHLFNIWTPNELAQTLNIGKSKIYKELSHLSIYQIRKMFLSFGIAEAIKEIAPIIEMSAATKSRYRITMGVDDTVVERIGKVIALVYSWYSGRCKKVIKGQNIIAITMKIGSRVMPLGMRLVAKQGCKNTSKPEIFKSMLEEITQKFQEAGIDLNQFPISFDSWYASDDLVSILKGNGFDQITIHAKGNFVFTIDGEVAKISEHSKRVELEENLWGCGGKKVARKKGVSKNFGKVALVFFEESERVKCLMSFGRALRACEVLNIWKQHHGIEEFWRALKSDCQIKKMRPILRQSTYTACAVKLLAYIVLNTISNQLRITIHQLRLKVRREIDVLNFFVEHFHMLKSKKPQILYG